MKRWTLRRLCKVLLVCGGGCAKVTTARWKAVEGGMLCMKVLEIGKRVWRWECLPVHLSSSRFEFYSYSNSRIDIFQFTYSLGVYYTSLGVRTRTVWLWDLNSPHPFSAI